MTAPIRRTVEYSTDPVVLAKQVGELARDMATQFAALTTATPMLMFAASNLGFTTTTRFLFPWFENSMATTAAIGYRLTRDGTLSSARLKQSGAGNGNAIIYTVLVTRRGVTMPTAIVVNAVSTSNEAENLTAKAAVMADDVVTIQCTKPAVIGASPSNVTFSLEYGAPT